MTKICKLLRCFALLVLVSLLLTGAQCSYGDDYEPETPTKPSTPQPTPFRIQTTTKTSSPHFAYPTEDTYIEVMERKRASLSVQIVGGAPTDYQWQVNKGTGWENVAGQYGKDRYYTTDANDSRTASFLYRCVVTVHWRQQDTHVTITSPVFHIKLQSRTTVSTTKRVTPSTSRARPTPSLTTRTTHRSRLYVCKSCDFKAESMALMKQHFRDNPGKSGHGSYATETKTYGGETVYHCGNAHCSMTLDGKPFYTKKQAELTMHLMDCPAHNEFTQNGYICSCGEVFFSEQDKVSHLEGAEASHTVQSVPWICNGCGSFFNSKADKAAHAAANPGTAGQSTVVNAKTALWYRCKGCNFTTENKTEIVAHAKANAPQEGHNQFTVQG